MKNQPTNIINSNISIVDSQSFSFTTRLFASNLYSTRDNYEVKHALCNFSKIHYILEGRLMVVANGKSMILRPGDFLLLPAGTRHSVSLIDNKKCLFYFADVSLHFDGNEFVDVLNAPYHVHFGLHQEVIDIFEEIIDTLSAPATHVNSIKQASLLIDLLLTFFDHCEDDSSLEKTPTKDAVSDTIDYIKQHFTEKLTVVQLAQMAYICTNYYTLRFKKLTGMSPIQYINSLRIKKAQELLETTDLSLNEIVNQINYYDLAQFCKAFKKYCGHTPTEYRKLAKNSAVLENDVLRQTNYATNISKRKEDK